MTREMERLYELLPFGECTCRVWFDYTPATDYKDSSVVIKGGQFYSCGRWINLTGEEASNLSPSIYEHCEESLPEEER